MSRVKLVDAKNEQPFAGVDAVVSTTSISKTPDAVEVSPVKHDQDALLQQYDNRTMN